MRQLVCFCAVLVVGCTQTRVVGPYRASLSRSEVQSIVQIAETIYPRYYSRMTLNAVAPDEVWVGTVSEGGTCFYDYSAVAGQLKRKGIPLPTVKECKAGSGLWAEARDRF